ncbi:hypothetical protein [Phaeovulum sp. NW3]|uniref:hypothetical protein n=1 Tax=Phaeovulum sp. NW3 TaxID=2934933 RepID=UPI0020216BEE|nr:hypothetical protein [Phaeovulum sp. NW3]MCL7464703.1 hypothetical protein [Phaeovulum sp. NW3]
MSQERTVTLGQTAHRPSPLRTAREWFCRQSGPTLNRIVILGCGVVWTGIIGASLL